MSPTADDVDELSPLPKFTRPDQATSPTLRFNTSRVVSDLNRAIKEQADFRMRQLNSSRNNGSLVPRNKKKHQTYKDNLPFQRRLSTTLVLQSIQGGRQYQHDKVGIA